MFNPGYSVNRIARIKPMDLILRRCVQHSVSKEGREFVPCLLPSFETHRYAMLLRMRFVDEIDVSNLGKAYLRPTMMMLRSRVGVKSLARTSKAVGEIFFTPSPQKLTMRSG